MIQKFLFLIIIILMMMIKLSTTTTTAKRAVFTIKNQNDTEIEIDEEGTYTISVTREMINSMGTLYLHAPIDRTITIKLLSKENIDCFHEPGSRIESLDGWKFYNQIFPAIDDPHYLGKDRSYRVQDFCVTTVQRVFFFNAGMISYQIKTVGSFTFQMKFFDYEHPCNIFLLSKYIMNETIRFDYKRIFNHNCTIYLIQRPYSSKQYMGVGVKILSLNLGNDQQQEVPLNDMPLSCQRFSKNKTNFLELGGWGNPPDYERYEMTVSTNDYCNAAYPKDEVPIFCPNVAMRIHINDHNIPNQHVELQYQSLNQDNLEDHLSKSPFELFCPDVPTIIYPELPIQLDTEECRQLLKTPGHYEVIIDKNLANKFCSIFILAPPKFEIEIEIVELLDYGKLCRTPEFIYIIDGWYYNYEYIPHHHDHKKDINERRKNICNEKDFKKINEEMKTLKFSISQNVAQIDYLLTELDSKFSFRLNYYFTKEPCNIVYHMNDIYDNKIFLLRNYRYIQNCAIYFTKEPWLEKETKTLAFFISIDHFSIGQQNNREDDNYIDDLFNGKMDFKPCIASKNITNDWMEIIGGTNFGVTSIMKPDHFQLCNELISFKMMETISPVKFIIYCPNIAMRLLSQKGEKFNNYIQFHATVIKTNNKLNKLKSKNVKEIHCTKQRKNWENYTKPIDPDNCEKEVIYHTGVYGVEILHKFVKKQCSVTIVAGHDELIEVTIIRDLLICDNLISYIKLFDGYEYGSERWPNDEDFTGNLRDRWRLICKKENHTFITSQNIAQIYYMISENGRGFQVNINFVKNLKPCNVLTLIKDPNLEKRTYEMKSISNIYACQFFILEWPWEQQIFSGILFEIKSFNIQSNTLTGCHRNNRFCTKSGINDYVQFYGDNNVDIFKDLKKHGFEFCFRPENYNLQYLVRYCRNMGIRMVSSRYHTNIIEFKLITVRETQLIPTMPFGHHIPFHRICRQPAWTKPKLKVPMYKTYPKMREYIEFIDEEPRPYEVFHEIKSTRITTPWLGPRKTYYPEIPEVDYDANKYNK